MKSYKYVLEWFYETILWAVIFLIRDFLVGGSSDTDIRIQDRISNYSATFNFFITTVEENSYT